MKRLLLVAVCCAAALAPVPAADQESPKSAKAALQVFNDFIGTWDGRGDQDKPRPDLKAGWSETLNWSWRFKGEDAWLVVKIKDGKYYKNGELRYLTDKRRYQLTLTDKKNKKQVFTGEYKDEYLTLERIDRDGNETQQIKINLAGDGARLIYRFAFKPKGRTVFTKDYVVALTKEGETLSAAEKKVECIISGGLGTIPVTYKGVTYHVCCTGCRDAFNENPEKYIKEYEAKKAGKK